LARTCSERTSIAEEEKRSMFSSARARWGVYDFIPAHLTPAITLMPTYAWPKRSPAAGALMAALLDVASNFMEASDNPRTYARALGRRLKQEGIFLEIADLGLLQTTVATIEELTAEGTRVPTSVIATLAELAGLLTISSSTLAVFRLCRAARVPVNEDEFAGWLRGKHIPGGTHVEACAARDRLLHTTPPGGPRPDRPRTCRTCGKQHVGAWATHVCASTGVPSTGATSAVARARTTSGTQRTPSASRTPFSQ
jgi:hypothetical protein